ncbi:hypothetical protein GQX73_g807 [Xylaria multiplex]|uniref:Saccharopine dehydrogenase NADP binding domain-containing protein n=1 Tax=Xylaria multiplex TaxID=323545 RepID=A0A7C8N0M5_9PEZI|nr:hypothetical protein GQX73_g807 [Xylaria multiplex]
MPGTQPKRREYDLLLVGATGHTGSLTAQHIVRHFPPNLRWVLAGRSEAKLQRLRESLPLNPTGIGSPNIQVLNLSESDRDTANLDDLIRRSCVCISVVTYFAVGELVIRSCVENETNYIDAIGDVILLERLIAKYHNTAERKGVKLIHAAGIFGGVQNLLAWAAARELAQQASLKTQEVALAMDTMKLIPSRGTIESFLHEAGRGKDIRKKTLEPWLLSSVEGSPDILNSTNKMNMRINMDLGALSATSITAKQNQLLVHRSWGLLKGSQEDYGANFKYNEYMRGVSAMLSLLTTIGHPFVDWLLGFKIVRNIVRRALQRNHPTSPGEADLVVMEAVAIADVENPDEAPRGYATLRYPEGPYSLTGLMLAQGAASILYSGRECEKGGCLTTALIAADLIQRLKGADIAIESTILPY